MATHLVIGSKGEVGSALVRLLRSAHTVYEKDLEDVLIPKGPIVDVMHVCIRHSADFNDIVREYINWVKPRYVDICSTVPVGTCEQLGDNVVHSTTRGLHPHLDEGLQTIEKFVAGPCAEEVAQGFEAVGIPCRIWPKARMSEGAHILNNYAYGAAVMAAQEMAKLCRLWGLDYYEVVMRYTQANNDGYEKLGHKSKCRMILTPPGNKIGGHCLVQSAQLVPEKDRPPIMDMLAKFNEEK